MLTAFRQLTIIRTFDPADGDRYVELHRLDGVSLSPNGNQLTLDNKTLTIHHPVRVDIDTKARLITTMITVWVDAAH